MMILIPEELPVLVSAVISGVNDSYSPCCVLLGTLFHGCIIRTLVPSNE